MRAPSPAEARLASRQAPVRQRRRAGRSSPPSAADRSAFKAADCSPFCRNRTTRAQQAQWRDAETYAYPAIGPTPSPKWWRQIAKVLDPIWKAKNPTARKVRGRIEAVLDAAAVRGQRGEENPARILSLRPVLGSTRPKTVPASARTSGFCRLSPKALRKRPGIAARTLEFTILTAARTGEVLPMKFPEVKERVWTVPEDRMKGGRVHRVPLSPRASAIVSEMAKMRHSAFVFPGRKGDRPASNMTMAAVYTPRKARRYLRLRWFPFEQFRDWAPSLSAYPREVVEAALAHIVGGVEGAYFRSDLFEKRRALMGDWDKFVGG